MSQLSITKRELIDIKNEVERLYCEAKLIDSIDVLLKEHSPTYVFEQLIGQYWVDLKILKSNTYVRVNIYDNLKRYKNSPDETLISLSSKFSRYLEKFLGYDYFGDIEIPRDYNAETKLYQFKGKHWSYYYYDVFQKKPGISTGILYIDNEQSVFIKDYIHEIDDAIEYKGSVDLIVDGSLVVMELKTKTTNERDLHIVAHTGNLGKLPQLIVGQYHNINHNLTIVSGTIILVETEHTYDAFIPRFAKQNSVEYLSIPEPIRRFFNSKTNNLIKVPKKIFTYASLIDWLNQKENQRPINDFDKDNLKLFISAPTTSLGSEENYLLFKSVLSEIREQLSIFKITVECILLRFENYKEFNESNILLSEIEEELSSCDLYMMILPRLSLKRQSSILIEFGYIMQKTIPKIIFIEDGILPESIPNLLAGAIINGEIKKYTFMNFKELVKKISRNGRKLFV